MSYNDICILKLHYISTGSGMLSDKKAYTLQEKGTISDQSVTQSVINEPLPVLCTMTKPCVAPCAQNGSKVKVSRCKDFGVEETLRKSYGHLSPPQDRVFSTCFHYKIKRKGGEFDKCEV